MKENMDTMRISFIVNEVEGGWEPTDKRLGGTERGVQEWAEELAKRGHKVIVFRNGHDNDFFYNGVAYLKREAYAPGEVTINVKSPEIPRQGPTLFYTNDVNANQQDLSDYDGVIHISRWAKANIPVNNELVFVIPHGYDFFKHTPGVKVPKQCLYSSSPDRGLETLLRAWVQVHEEHPDATLKVTYGAEALDIPGVEFLGDVSEEEMAKLYRESQYWLHPCTGAELQCIAGLKAQAAGCIPVVIPAMALEETIEDGYFAETPELYTDTLSYALSGEENEQILKRLSKKKFTTIQESTNMLLDAIGLVL